MLGNLIGGFIVILVGVTIVPTIVSEVSEAGGMNVTGSVAGTTMGLVTFFFALGIMSAGVAIAAQGLRGDETADRIQKKLRDVRKELGIKEKDVLVVDDFKEPSWFERKFLKKKGLMEKEMEEDLKNWEEN